MNVLYFARWAQILNSNQAHRQMLIVGLFKNCFP